MIYVRPEEYGTRALDFSGWHRKAHGLFKMIDLDCIEFCHRCGDIIALVELAQDKGHSKKPTTVMRRLAKLANRPAYLVFYVGNGKVKDEAEIYSTRTKMVYPRYSKEIPLSPNQYKAFLVMLRIKHGCVLSYWHKLEPPESLQETLMPLLKMP